MSECVSWSDVEDARERLRGAAVLTPLLHNRFLDEVVAREVLLKPESLQVAGSFKFRGAYNRINRAFDERGGLIHPGAAAYPMSWT